MTGQISKSRLWWERSLKAVKAAAPSRALAFVLILMLLVLAAQTAQAQTLTVLHSFGGKGDGADANRNLLLDAKGNLYGTTAVGGPHSSGVVFEWTANNTYKVLYT